MNVLYGLLIFCACSQAQSGNAIVDEPQAMPKAVNCTLKSNVNYPVNFYYISELVGTPVNLAPQSEISLTITQPTFLMAANGSQTPFIIQPGDQITITLDSTKKDYRFVINSPTRLREVNFFHDLVQAYGGIRLLFNTTYITKPVTLKQRDSIIETTYTKRINFLNSYAAKYPITNDFKQMATAIISYARINEKMGLYYRGFNKEAIAQFYTDSLCGFAKQFQSTDFLTNTIYRTALEHVVRMHYKEARPNIPVLSFNGLTNEVLQQVYSDAGTNDCLNEAAKKYIQATAIQQMIFNVKASGKPNYQVVNDLASGIKNTPYYDYLINQLQSEKEIDKAQHFYEAKLYTQNGDTPVAFKQVLDTYKGKYVLIDCWATWCVPCITHLPDVNEAALQLAKKDVVVLYFSFDKNRELWQAFKSPHIPKGNSYLVKNEFNSSIASFFRIDAIPRYILFDKSGKVIAKDVQFHDANSIAQLIK